jgi:hypothetical protein
MFDLPGHEQDLYSSQNKIIQRDGRNGHQQAYGCGFKGQGKAGHDFARVHEAVTADHVKREHDAQNRSQQADIRRIASDGGNEMDFARELQLKAFIVGEGIQSYGSEEKEPFDADADSYNAKQNQKSDNSVIDYKY